ncbi:alpha/beta fold hydrolase [Conexibacter sp. W3-3-2]|uniref:alpha/beta hydrolase n=1 Tax=Conexibacter sp. W3-3-2 TaxID=2675227 RepID=UPI0012B79BB5|nr:alpha/beta fold hydrolase [Conexibacter sp. W3-3-2]MTD46350.1 alpha/beta fold hydrolase [Conexibacter sp. W3-3-2]
MPLDPTLIDVHVPERPRGAVLVLHGGASRGAGARVSPSQLSVLRMVPIARRIAREGGDDVAVVRLLNRFRGWDGEHSPVDDAHWALEQLQERLGELPVSLVGHSLGGRAALLAAGHPAVRSVAALAPWVYPEDVEPGIRGKQVLIVHGDRDRVASPVRAQELARRLSRIADVRFEVVPGGKHAMLRHRDAFDGRAATFAVRSLASGARVAA